MNSPSGGRALPGVKVVLDTPPDGEFITRFIQRAGGASRDAQRVEVPFAQVAPPPEKLWSGDTTEELRVPIGRAAATKLQWLELGRDTRQHGLVAGKTGSGKSTLFHVLITNLALWHAPDQVEFYLIDFKKGVEFKCYAAHCLPHARVVAIESDREFGLSVLQRVDDELRRRGDLFRGVGAQNLSTYRRVPGTAPLPRTLLIIDEFQEFFVEDDKVAQTASVLLDRIVRQGRAFGIHVLLGSQTLGGAYTVARATLGQMVVRIALQCNETDACLIMDDDNPAPRLLSRPGEGIYNDAAGRIEGNSPFQAVWLDDATRDASLREIRERADQPGNAWPGPIVFEGNAPADVCENLPLAEWLEKGALRVAGTGAPRLWLGAPNSIKGPTEVEFRRQSGHHLLVVGQNDEAVLAMLGIGLVSLAAQFPAGGVRMVVFDTSPPGSPEREYMDRTARCVPREIQWVRGGELAGALASLVRELDQRLAASAPDSPPIFAFIPGAQKFGRLRPEDEFSFGDSAEAVAKPSAHFQRLVSEGAAQGMHLIVTFDTGANAQRFLGRKGLAEFAARVLFQMSANDSALLMDSVRAGALGLNRALLFNEQEGHTEIFRPYARPDNGWFAQASVKLNQPAGPVT
jgi:DNA segregation ATPase FtsK/SpoIIIE, S-DNA-T family